ncbi:Zinc finger CCHC-type and RNA-binding motif-containing protein 1 [Paragonimus heterotremus]|uniref:Zinc finger CCHC-type and RNA-binding motif-containing protein 1 n=1 Tax=Paragonimus heterotremus TaxID=100268 RepID=A0A8J4TMV4_9TREM|nr:Zinc finger CCHC-type and RNA-binding motif-containing protein 1 [Paragonimus heterotremus]
MSGNLAPSKSTVYISNLPFSLTNNDIHQILLPYGKVVRITVVKDRESRRSKGVAFALFLDRNEARQCALKLNNSSLLGRTIKASIAKDNGRAAEFIRRREYPNKSRCYECGEFGHLSYKCSRNILGEREPPVKKKKVRKQAELNCSRSRESGGRVFSRAEGSDAVTIDRINEPKEEDDEGEEPDLDSWSSAVIYEANLTDQSGSCASGGFARKRRIRPDSYFSDEEELEDDGA